MRRATLLELARKERDDWIRVRIQDTLRLTYGNWSEAARLSGMDRTNLRRLARRVGAL